jgi:hypothetical protein
MKQKKTMLIALAVAVLSLAFVTCKPEPDPEQPQFREATITLNFDTNAYTIKVSGTLLASEWNGVPGRVESLLENAYPIGTTIDDTDIQDAMNTVFARTGVNVIVEDTSAYSNYKIIGDGITLNLRYSALNSISTNTIIDAVNNGMLINKTHID